MTDRTDPTRSGQTPAVRETVRTLAAFAPLPPEPDWQPEKVDAFRTAIQQVAIPITEQEHRTLLTLLDRPREDDIYGFLQSVIPMLESYPGEGWERKLPTNARPWFDYLRTRLANRERYRSQESPNRGDR